MRVPGAQVPWESEVTQALAQQGRGRWRVGRRGQPEVLPRPHGSTCRPLSALGAPPTPGHSSAFSVMEGPCHQEGCLLGLPSPRSPRH